MRTFIAILASVSLFGAGFPATAQEAKEVREVRAPARTVGEKVTLPDGSTFQFYELGRQKVTINGTELPEIIGLHCATGRACTVETPDSDTTSFSEVRVVIAAIATVILLRIMLSGGGDPVAAATGSGGSGGGGGGGGPPAPPSGGPI